VKEPGFGIPPIERRHRSCPGIRRAIRSIEQRSLDEPADEWRQITRRHGQRPADFCRRLPGGADVEQVQ
jgi:hypothetical protein